MDKYFSHHTFFDELFREHYRKITGALIRKFGPDQLDLIESAVQEAFGQVPKIHALIALMLFCRARLKTRTDSFGNILLLKDQDRSQWDKLLLQEGAKYLSLSMQNENGGLPGNGRLSQQAGRDIRPSGRSGAREASNSRLK